MRRKIAIITGSTKGIGLATAEKLLSEGYFVFISYCNDESTAAKLDADLKLQYPEQYKIDRVDLSDYNEALSYINMIKCITESIDVLILSATVTDRCNFEDISIASFEKIMRANITIPFLFVQQLVELLSKGEDKSIIFIGSIVGIYPHAMSLAYGVSKSAEHALAINLVKFLEPFAIRTNVICPGFVETDMQKNKPQEIRDSICNKIALHRFANIDEIVDAIIFLIKNTYINGELLNVNGAYSYK